MCVLSSLFQAAGGGGEEGKLVSEKPTPLNTLLTVPGKGTSLPSDSSKALINPLKTVHSFEQLTLVSRYSQALATV